MRRAAIVLSWRTLGAPLRVPLWRAVLEGALGCGLLIWLAALISGGTGDAYTAPAGAVILTLVGRVWLLCWPAWRLAEAPGKRSWRRAGAGIGRALFCGLALGLVLLLLGSWLWPALIYTSPWAVPSTAGGATIAFVLVRLVVVIAATLVRRARRRLRWQLTASHLAVIVLTFVTMTAVGSVIAVTLVFAALHPDARAMASSVADLLRLAGAATPVDRSRATQLLSAIEQPGRVPLRGQSLFATLEPLDKHPNPNPEARLDVPVRVMLLDTDGRVLAAAANPTQARLFKLTRAAAPLPASVWGPLRREALAGRATAIALYTVVRLSGQQVPANSLTGAAPIAGRGGHTVAVVVVQTFDIAPLPMVLLPSILNLFLIGTMLLLLALLLPVLGIAGLFGYLLSRGLTRRIEAVSRVTTAIASGDLTGRAPVTTVNEIGRLAEDVNRMAAHLETTMGALRAARAQAEEALEARQHLVASISHELRTPLAIVRAHLETLLMREPAPFGARRRQEEADVVLPASTLHALQVETERLSGLVDDLFALSRAQSGALDVRCDRVDVAALVSDVAALMRPLAQREGMIALSVEAPPGLPPALADPDRLRQILENLVRNAVRHTPDGGIIILSVTVEASWLVVAVADTGEGIPPEHLAHIFDRFYRVEQARTRSGGGAGLGLAIVREFVELMGGRVSVESVPGEGSCFRVFLPLAPSGFTTGE